MILRRTGLQSWAATGDKNASENICVAGLGSKIPGTSGTFLLSTRVLVIDNRVYLPHNEFNYLNSTTRHVVTRRSLVGLSEDTGNKLEI